MFSFARDCFQRRRATSDAWRRAALLLIEEDEPTAFYEAQLRAYRARKSGDRGRFWHWAKVATEVARESAVADLDREKVLAILDYDESDRINGAVIRKSAREICARLKY